MLILDGYDSHLTYQFVRYCELHKVILLQLPAHSTHFLQPLDVVIFQQWKHWHTEAIDLHIRKGIGDFNRQTFLANLESIRQLTLKSGNIKSAFRRCGFVPFRPHVILRLMPANETPYEPELQPENENENELLPIQWEPPQTHEATQLQAEAIQDMLRSSVTPPDTPTRRRNRANVATFKQGILASNILQTQLTNYM